MSPLRLSHYASNREVYGILMDAVAGGVPSGVVHNGNCQLWEGMVYCNTYDRIKVAFADYHMDVELESSREDVFDCWKPRPTVKD
jgi:hypothetical protein